MKQSILSPNTRLFLINPRDALNSALSLDRARQHKISVHGHHRFFCFLQICRRGVSDRQFPGAEADGGGGGEAVIVTGDFPIVSSNVRSAGASVAGSISGAPDDHHNSTSDWKTERYKEIIESGTSVYICFDVREEVIIVTQHSENGKHS
ncbi:hypothetical protein ACSBR1_025790 [Camellia fascicularis]